MTRIFVRHARARLFQVRVKTDGMMVVLKNSSGDDVTHFADVHQNQHLIAGYNKVNNSVLDYVKVFIDELDR